MHQTPAAVLILAASVLAHAGLSSTSVMARASLLVAVALGAWGILSLATGAVRRPGLNANGLVSLLARRWSPWTRGEAIAPMEANSVAASQHPQTATSFFDTRPVDMSVRTMTSILERPTAVSTAPVAASEPRRAKSRRRGRTGSKASASGDHSSSVSTKKSRKRSALDPDLRARLSAASRAQGTRQSEIVRRALRAYLSELKRTKSA